MDYERGLKALKERVGEAQWQADFLTLEARLRENLSQARHYGDTETRRAERAQIVDALNQLALETVKVSFNELCGQTLRGEDYGQEPETVTEPAPLPFSLERYLERLQSQVLNAFRQDQYVMLTVESLESEDPVTLLALQQALRSAFDVQVEEETRGGGEQQPVEEAINSNRLVALLGDPGIGKTTSLRFAALRQIERVRTGAGQLVPVWVSLGKWVDKEMPAEAFLWHEFVELLDDEVTQNTFENLLAQGRLLLLLDGLNELPQRELELRGSSLSQLGPKDDGSEKHSFDPRENSLLVLARERRSRFVLSCRILEYTHLPGWREFRILSLDDGQIKDFVQRHLGQRSQRLKKILEQQPDLRDIMRNPFFLRSLIRLVQEDWQQVPTDRFQLVQYTCQAALHREASRRGLDVDGVAILLGEMSLYSMVDGWIGSWFSILLELDSEVEGEEKPETVTQIDAMQCAEGAGLVIRTQEEAEQVAYRYLHQLVQEALALAYLKTEQFKEEEYPEARSLARIGEAHLDWGKLKEAQENFLRAVELCPTVGAETDRASILLSLSKVYRFWRQSQNGLEYAETALQLLDRTGDTVQLAEAYHELGSLNMRLRQRKEAEKNYRLSLEVYDRLGNQSKYAYEIISGLADLYSAPMVYKIREAIDWYQKAIKIFEEQNDAFGMVRTELEVAHARRLCGEMDRAEELFKACATKLEQLEQPWLHINSLEFWGYTLRDTRRFSEAEAILGRALDAAQQKDSRSDEIDILIFGLAWVASYQGKRGRGIELLNEALGLAKQQANPTYLTKTYGKGFGYISWRAKDFENAANYFLLCDKTMDEEYRHHLAPIDRLGINWAKIIGVHTGAHCSARLVSGFLWILTQLWERFNNPSHWFGRKLYRFGWWLHRF